MTKLTTQLNELKTLKATFPRGTDGRVQYTNEFRQRVVELVESKSMGVTQSHILKELSLGQVMFCKWRRNFKQHGYATKVAVSASRKQHTGAVATLKAKRAELMSEIDKINQAIKLLEELGV